MNRHDDLPLFRWKPPECVVLPFPPINRIGKIRTVARKWLDQRTEKQRLGYCRKIDSDLRRQLSNTHATPGQQEILAVQFWSAVDRQITILSYGDRQPGDGAA